MAPEAPARRRRTRKPDPLPQPSSLLASAAALTAATFERAVGIGQPFQKESWDLYEAVGPMAYVADWYENALGKAKLIAMRLGPDGLERVTSGPAYDTLATFAGGPILQKTLVGSLGIHLFVPGECFIVGQDQLDPNGNETGRETWRVYSTEELTWSGNGWRLDIGDGKPKDLDEGRPKDLPSLVIRVWNPAPRRSWLADSPVRHVLTDLREYVAITLAVNAILQSRLAGNGLLLLPSEIDFPTGDADPTSTFMQVLLTVMERALANPGSAAAAAPLVVQVKGEFLEKVQHLTFWSELDEHLAPMRETCITRIALGLDIPKEVLTGSGDISHWGAWQISEDAITLHIEPALLSIVIALTDGWYRAALEARGVPDPETYVVWYDTSELTQRPNNFGEALQLYDRGGVEIAAVRRAGGYPESAAAKPEDIARLKELGGAVSAVSVSQTKEAPQPAALLSAPDVEVPGCDCDRATLLAAADARVLRALEVVGKRLAVRQDRAATKSIPAHELHVALHGREGPRLPAARLFADLWPGLPDLAAEHAIDPAGLEQTLHGYVRSLVSNGEPHTTALLADTLDAAGY